MGFYRCMPTQSGGITPTETVLWSHPNLNKQEFNLRANNIALSDNLLNYDFLSVEFTREYNNNIFTTLIPVNTLTANYVVNSKKYYNGIGVFGCAANEFTFYHRSLLYNSRNNQRLNVTSGFIDGNTYSYDFYVVPRYINGIKY